MTRLCGFGSGLYLDSVWFGEFKGFRNGAGRFYELRVDRFYTVSWVSEESDTFTRSYALNPKPEMSVLVYGAWAVRFKVAALEVQHRFSTKIEPKNLNSQTPNPVTLNPKQL